MFTYSEVEEKLNSSQWPDEAKKLLLPLLPRLGKWSLSYISQQINATGSKYSAEDVVNIISLQPVWYESLQKSRTQDIVVKANEIIATEQEDLHRALLSVILDIRTNKAMAALVPTDVSKIFDRLEVLYLRNLPPSEVADILLKRVNRISEVANLQMEIKRYCYYRDINSKDEPEIILFRRALESNEQLIGSNPKSVKSWIDDFMQAAATSKDLSMYNVAQYVTNNSATKNLSPVEKTALADILKLYNWLFQPHTTAEEIESYEKYRMGNEPVPQTASTPQPLPAAPIAPPKNVAPMSIPEIKPVQPIQAKTLPQFDAARPTPSPTLTENKYTPPQPAPAPVKTAPSVVKPFQTINSAQIQDLINQKPKQKMGVVMDPTNVKLEEEKRRMAKDRDDQKDIIALKLAELRKRNKTNDSN